ncbi:MAG: tetratricopeptide repeat protein [Acidobacteria bacterium]|nr:tetratricopeptide repeat protein [Acidobacteriota bacterium]
MNKFLKTGPAWLLLACACAPCALAQEASAPKGGEVVRVRRVAAAETKDGATPEEAETAGAPGEEVESLRAKAEAASNPSERARLRLSLAEALAEGGRQAEAVALVRTLVSEERFDPQFFYNAGNALARLGESDAAADAYRKAVAQRRGNYALAQHNLGVVLTRLGRWEEAEGALRAALRLENDTYAEASYSLGRLHALRGESGLAAAEWVRTLRLRPDHGDAAAALARTLAEGGDEEQALAVLDAYEARAKARGTTVPREVTVARGEIVAAANVYEAARAAGTKQAAEGGAKQTAELPDSASLLRAARASKASPAQFVVEKPAYDFLLNARAARASDRPEQAVEQYRRAIREAGGYLAPANMELGLTLVGLRRNEEAAAFLLPVARKEGGRYPLVFYHLGRIYEHAGRLDEAGEAFARASELAGEENPQFYVDLSRVREQEGRNADALAAAESYVRAMARAGEAPEWARARVESLRKKAGQGAAPPAAPKP